LQKFTQKKLNRSENIPNSFRLGATFLETPCILFCTNRVDFAYRKNKKKLFLLIHFWHLHNRR